MKFLYVWDSICVTWLQPFAIVTGEPQLTSGSYFPSSDHTFEVPHTNGGMSLSITDLLESSQLWTLRKQRPRLVVVHILLHILEIL